MIHMVVGSSYWVWALPGVPKEEAVFIVDRDGDISVTNDAESVVAYVLTNYGTPRIIYRDTNGRWDELCHDGARFTGFAPITLDEIKAICRL